MRRNRSKLILPQLKPGNDWEQAHKEWQARMRKRDEEISAVAGAAGPLPHKEILELPTPDLSHDEGDPDWAGEHFVPVEGRSTYRLVHEPGANAQHWAHIQERWAETAAEFEATPDDVYRAWRYLDGHPVFWEYREPSKDSDYPAGHVLFLEDDDGMAGAVDIYPTHPAGEDDGLLWAGETGPLEWPFPGHPVIETHDVGLDVTGATYEAVVVGLARRVWAVYGNDRRAIDEL